MTITEIELFVAIVNRFHPLTIVTKSFISDVTVVLNTSLKTLGD